MITLEAGEATLALDPDTGGAIAALAWRGTALLRPVSDPRLAAQRGRAVGAYPLIPFANRIAWGRFGWDGVVHQLARNFGDHPHAIHGNAWMRRWTVGEHAAARARLSLDHVPPHDPVQEWPFAYHAEQLFELAPESLRVTMSVQNCDRRAWPAGIGLHPYVARPPGASLRFGARAVWTTDADSLPDRLVPVPEPEDFAEAREIGPVEIDACYVGWDGWADLAAPDHPTVEIQAVGPLGHLQVYTPSGRDYVGLEPVSHMPDAVNRASDTGLCVLQPGATLEAVVKFTLTTPGGRTQA